MGRASSINIMDCFARFCAHVLPPSFQPRNAPKLRDERRWFWKRITRVEDAVVLYLEVARLDGSDSPDTKARARSLRAGAMAHGP